MVDPEHREQTPDFTELAKVKAAVVANDPMLKALTAQIAAAEAESKGKPLISRGSFAQYAEDE